MTQRRIYQCAFPYFITFNVHEAEWIFNDAKKAELLHDIILKSGEIKNHNIYQFCVMPNHVHILCKSNYGPPRRSEDLHCGSSIINNQPQCGFSNPRCETKQPNAQNAITISHFVKCVRGTFAKKMNRGRIWQPRFYDRIIRSMDQFSKVSDYIERNPIKAGLDKRWQDHPYQYKNTVLIQNFWNK